MEFEHKSGIYKCTCRGNGKSYIGQSKDVKLRKYAHIADLRHNSHYNTYWQNSWNKYGEESFIWEVVEYCDCDLLNDREKFWIAYFDTFKNGFNSTKGGSVNPAQGKADDLKQRLSESLKESWANDEERRKRFSENMKGTKNPMYGRTGRLNPAYGKDHSGNFNGMYGKSQSEDAKEKNRQAHLGAKNKCSKPVVCIETQTYFASQGEAKRLTGCDDTSINKCLRGVIKSAGGYHWRYATEEEIKNQTYIA